tara:strand:+ start:303 stop:476 length:174 start_codon:yes stop_codon:yes gene_type:complete
MSKEIEEERERIKDLVEDRLRNAKAKNYIRVGSGRLDYLIKCICFNIDNPDYVRKED